MKPQSERQVFIFTGPTLSAAEACQVLDAVYLPPVAQGDVYRVARLRPKVIGLIDGYFDTMPSVWHKEILWAMREGIHVFGAASMGALRAAELAAFGMEGVGQIYEAYRRGELEDDDEVAVAHAPAEHGYRALSMALVNLRATLAAAEAAHVIRPATRAALIQMAKELFYTERTYPRLFDEAATKGVDRAELEALKAWLPRGEVDQKREDARAMLQVIRERLAAGLEPKQVHYQFEHTIYWEYLVQTAGEGAEGDDSHDGRDSFEALLDEARLDHTIYRLARQEALNRALAHVVAGQQGQRVTAERLEETILSFRRTRGLLDSEATDAWLKTNDLNPASFTRLMEEEARVRAAMRWAGLNLSARVLEQLRLDGRYAELRARANDKQRALEEAGLANPELADAGLTRAQLLEWYFERGGRRIPVDLNQYAREAGFRDEHFLIRALLREFCYLRLGNSTAGRTHRTQED